MVTFEASELHTLCRLLELLEKEQKRNYDLQKIIQSVTQTMTHVIQENRRLQE